jgi:2-oxoisovalerate ferredoxin oxidoreductase beta subunit
MTKTFPLGAFRERTRDAEPRPRATLPPSLDEIPKILGVDDECLPTGRSQTLECSKQVDLEVRVAGFGGQGVLLLGEVIAEAGLDYGLEVSWLPSYGPEMRSGTSNCHVRVSTQPIDSPMVTNPSILLAMNEPSLRKFHQSVRDSGWILCDAEAFPEDCQTPGVNTLALPFTQIAHDLGDARACNMVMLGALLEITEALPQSCVDAALHRLVRNPKWIKLDERALMLGRRLFREWQATHAPETSKRGSDF